MRPASFAVPAALVVAAIAPAATPAVPAYVRSALAAPARADQAADDARRQAAAVLAFSGVKPGDTVVDFLPGGGYWTRIFSGIVGPRGRVLAIWPQAGAKYAEKSLPALKARNLANVTPSVDPALLTVDRPVDLVWTVQNYHDAANNGAGEAGLAALNAAVFKALKPGGTYVLIDHAATAGSGLAATSTTHRIDPVAAKAQVLKAGFQFVGESRVLANPADDHGKNVFDPTIRGHTDQFVFKFRRPR
ncbi:methyltransferase [Sphingomonas aracearum]|uniref:Methyltransferase n=1 Tax=Sphingomonas aracearum TaxID=2283317 RepID=A0A369VTN1_9SPHN|nr:methyltransferase [Sphingomonas aracearum]